MARIRTLRQRVKEIVRKYKHVNAHKFFYNKPGELRGKYRRIRVWYLIHDTTRGYSIMRMDWKRIVPMNVETWVRLHRESVGEYQSLYSIFTQAVLPAINNKGGNAWRFISLLGWTGIRDSRSAKDSKTSRRNKTVKKRDANARHRNRRRHRNRKGRAS